VAFGLRSAEDCPPDFALPDSLAGFHAGLFLPGDTWPPRLLLLQRGGLAIVSHPSAGEPVHRWTMEQIGAVESGHMLLKGWLRFTGADFDYTCPL
jgi:hypothetical protein